MDTPAPGVCCAMSPWRSTGRVTQSLAQGRAVPLEAQTARQPGTERVPWAAPWPRGARGWPVPLSGRPRPQLPLHSRCRTGSSPARGRERVSCGRTQSPLSCLWRLPMAPNAWSHWWDSEPGPAFK